MGMKKRVLSFILVLCMVCTLLPVGVFAANIVDSGMCGDNLTWTLDSEGTLTISGTGEMEDYIQREEYSSAISSPPWARNLVTSVTIKEGVTSVGGAAFYECDKLSDVVISDSVKSLGDSAFKYCKSLTSITIPKSVTRISDCAFAYSGITSVIIPDSVTSVEDEVFSGCTGLTTVLIPDSVTSIGEHAFSGCSALESIKLPDSVTKIGFFAFSCCTALKNVDIPDSVTTLDDGTFEGCTSLTSAALSDSLTSISDFSFDGCTSLTSIYVPDSVTSVGQHAFGGCSALESIKLPDSVTKIGFCAFECCTALKNVYIPDSVTSIGEWAFRSCTNLVSINVGANNKWYTSVEGVLFSKDRKTLICYPVGKSGSYTIPHSVTSIGDYAFEECITLTSVDIPDSVTSIGEYSFYNCTGLTSVGIPDSVTSIGYSAFSLCTGLISVTLGNGLTSISDGAFMSCVGLTSVDIPDNVTSIGNSAFSYCVGLTSVDIPDKVTTIEPCAFSGCTSLSSVNIGNNVMNIGEYAFSGCIALPNVTIGNAVTSIGKFAFYECSGLTNVKIGNSVTSIGRYAFECCTALKSFDVPASNNYYTSIDGVLFSKDRKMLVLFPEGKNASYIVPDGVTGIEAYAFYSCYKLTSITIPESVTSIGEGAFDGCYNVTDAYYAGTEEQWHAIDFGWNSLAWSATIHYNSDGPSTDISGTNPNHEVLFTYKISNFAQHKMYESCGTYPTAKEYFYFSDSLFSDASSQYNHKLATASLGMTMASVNGSVAYKRTGSEYLVDLFKEIGFSRDNIHTSVGYADTSNITDTCQYVYGVKKLENGEYLIPLVIRSCEYGGGWASNVRVYDPSIDANSKYSVGFYGAAKTAYSALANFINELEAQGIDGSKINVWVTGFSRGGATSNLVGGMLNQNLDSLKLSKDNIFVYTFATPRTVKKSAAVAYDNIHNIINEMDMVTAIPLGTTGWDYARYGIDHCLPNHSNSGIKYNSKLKGMRAEFNNIMDAAGVENVEYSPIGGQELVLDLLIDYLDDVIESDKYYYENGLQDYLYKMQASEYNKGAEGITVNKILEDLFGDYEADMFGETVGVDVYLNYFITNFSNMSWNEKYAGTLIIVDSMNNILKSSKDTVAKRVATLICEFATRYLAYLAANNVSGGLISNNKLQQYDNTILAVADIIKNGRNSAILMQHWPEEYLAWLRSSNDGSGIYSAGTHKKLAVKCPVDITVYDSNNTVVGKVVNEAVDESIENCLLITVDAFGEKNIYIPDDDTYRIEIVAREEGTLDIVSETIGENGESIATDCYIKLEMEANQQFSINDSFDELTVKTNDETLVPDFAAGEVTPGFGISVTSIAPDNVVGAGTYALGETVELIANNDKDSCFRGWYENNTLISTDEAIHFTAVEDRTIEARVENHSYVDGLCTYCGARKTMQENPFVDVQEGSVYYDAILWAYYHEPQQITGGFDATHFRPKNPCTRAQVVTFLWRAKGCPEPTTTNNPFSDVSAKQANGNDNPYYKAILWAAEEGITTGYDGGLFKPNATVTRGQFVTFLWRAEGKPATTGSINGFADAANIPASFRQAVAWAVEKGITTGYAEANGTFTFRPNAACTRGAVVMFMHRDMA